MFSGEIKNNKIINQKVVGETSGAIIASYFFKDCVYYVNAKGDIMKFDIKTNRITNQSLNFKKNRFEVIKLHTLYLDSNEFLWTSGFRAGGNVKIDIKNGEKKVYHRLDQAEVIFEKGNNLYFGEYPDANLFVYNTNLGWDKSKGNPSLIAQIVGQDRIVTAATSSELNEVFFGTVPEYGKLGGSLLIVTSDKKIKELKLYKDLSIVSLMVKDKKLYGGTSISGGLGSKPIANEGELFIYDPYKMQIIYETVPVNGEIAITSLTEVSENRIAGIAGGTLFIFNTSKKLVEDTIQVYNAISKTDIIVDASLVHINNKIYLGSRRGIFCVNLLSRQVVQLYKKGTHLTYDGKNTLYYLVDGDIKSFNLK